MPVVAVLLPRSADSVLATVAVAAAGCTFLGLDTNFPHRRVSVALRTARANLVIVPNLGAEVGASLGTVPLPTGVLQATLEGLLAAPLSPGSSELAAPADGSCNANADPDPDAVIVFTSGSTGTPTVCASTLAEPRLLLRRRIYCTPR